jgi:hypothetical protein
MAGILRARLGGVGPTGRSGDVLPCLAGIRCGRIQPAEPPDPEASKKDLFRLMDALEAKLPRELARSLIVIRMKIATGWCSPYQAKEFEGEVEKLSERERKHFEKEWKLVREHDAWPCVAARKQSGSSPPKR